MDRFFAELNKAFAESVEVEKGTVRRPAQPVSLDEIALASVADLAVSDELLNDYGPGMALVHAGHLEVRTIVDFERLGGVTSWDAQIDILSAGNRTYVCLGPDPDMEWEWMAIAAVEPGEDPAAMAAFLKSYLATNGAAYGAEIFGGLPSEIRSAPELISRAGIRAALDGWLDYAVADDHSSREELLATAMTGSADAASGGDPLDQYLDEVWTPLSGT